MERLLEEIRRYATATGRSPQAVLRTAINANWRVWSEWQAGRATPTMRTVEALRTYMREHPPEGRESA